MMYCHEETYKGGGGGWRYCTRTTCLMHVAKKFKNTRVDISLFANSMQIQMSSSLHDSYVVYWQTNN